MAKSLEQPEIKEWLGSTKDMLMAEKSGKDKDEEAKKLNGILENFDKMLPKIADTRAVVDCLWKCYQVSVLSTYWDIFHIAPDIILKKCEMPKRAHSYSIKYYVDHSLLK